MRRKVATTKKREEEPSVVPPQEGRGDPLELIFSPLRRGDGFRHGALGSPGAGKTVHAREVVARALELGLVDLVLTHDTKGAEPEFQGTLAASIAEVATAELERTRHAVLRGDARRDIECSAEAVAVHGKSLAQREGLRVLLNVSELDNCLSDGGRAWEAPAVRWFSAQGRQLGACLLWTAQQPKRTPDEVFDQSTSIAFFRLDVRSANYLSNTLLLDERMVAELPRLGVGQYVLRIPGFEWDGRTYRTRLV